MADQHGYCSATEAVDDLSIDYGECDFNAIAPVEIQLVENWTKKINKYNVLLKPMDNKLLILEIVMFFDRFCACASPAAALFHVIITSSQVWSMVLYNIFIVYFISKR